MRDHKQQKLRIIGIELRTSNDVAFTEIPIHWKMFAEKSIAQHTSGKISNDVYAVYTNFENEGINNEGVYSFVIGVPVEGDEDAPEGLTSVVIPEADYKVFAVPGNDPSRVGEAWMEIWSLAALAKSFVCDYEKYSASGEVEIFVGVN